MQIKIVPWTLHILLSWVPSHTKNCQIFFCINRWIMVHSEKNNFWSFWTFRGGGVRTKVQKILNFFFFEWTLPLLKIFLNNLLFFRFPKFLELLRSELKNGLKGHFFGTPCRIVKWSLEIFYVLVHRKSYTYSHTHQLSWHSVQRDLQKTSFYKHRSMNNNEFWMHDTNIFSNYQYHLSGKSWWQLSRIRLLILMDLIYILSTECDRVAAAFQ